MFSLQGCHPERENNLRLLYWNIQNGMWDGQGDNYDRFVDWVKQQDPDICVWCEAQTIWKTDSDKVQPKDERYLVDNWGELAARYGHEYWGIGGHRDNYPQVITSKYPIIYESRITGSPEDTLVSHGAGWAKIEKNGRTFNIVTLHTWPQGWSPQDEDREKSRAEHGGDRYRRTEIEYICRHTLGQVPEAGEQYWMMMGDFNAPSRLDNAHYGWAVDEPRFQVHDYMLQNTPLLDVIHDWHPGTFIPSVGSKASRIDFVYCSKPLFDLVQDARIVWDAYTTPERDPQGLSNFWRPSDHLPIIVDFKVNEE
ncbi:MAG: endonuclease [Bacteroidales bacterium]|nr:endonuclease [Bacteroidales bacterium]